MIQRLGGGVVIAAAAIVWVMQGCSSDDPVATAPDASTPTDASTSDDGGDRPEAGADSGPPATTAGTCGATKASVRFGTPESSAIDSSDELRGLAVSGTDLFFAGWRREVADGGTLASMRLHFGRLDAARAPVWTKTLGAGARGHAMALDADGGMIVVGQFVTSLNVGGADLTSSTLFVPDAFVARFDEADGAHRFSVRLGGSDADAATAVTVDSAGNVWVAGTFSGDVSFGATQLTSTNADVFVARLDLDGNVLGAFKRSGAGLDGASAIAVAPVSGDLFIAGTSSSDPGGGVITGYVTKVSTTGEERWSKTFTGTRHAVVSALALDAGGDAFVAGTIDGRALVVRFDANGNEKWRKEWGADGDESASALAVGPDGSVLVGGSVQSTGQVDFGGGKLGGGSNGGTFVVELAGDGAHRCSRVWMTKDGPPPPDGGASVVGASASALAFTGTTSFVAAGSFGGVLDVGKGPMTSAGGTDVWVGDFNR